ncbi:MAG: Vms1/Ankzf1 family peptidyl-tRNA hydrolase [Thermodesulfovibrionales bacterium]
MLDRNELKDISSFTGKNGYFVSLYLNVDPLYNKKGDYLTHFKNMVKEGIEKVDKAIYKRIKDDIEKIENYVLTNKRMFRKGLCLISSSENDFWREYHINVPVRNDLIIDKTPFVKPLMDLLDNYQRYALLLVDKESARIFIIHLGEIVEYGEVHSSDVPGKHKKGGWFALSQNHYERHIDYHVGLHLKDVLERFGSFLSGEYIGRVIIGGSDEAVSMVKERLPKEILERVISNIRIEMFAKPDEILKKVQPLVYEYERKKEEEEVQDLINRSLKNENAVIGLDNVLNALQQQRVMKLFVLKDYNPNGFSCNSCGYLSSQDVNPCPYCGNKMEAEKFIVDSACEKAIQQGALIEVIAENKELAKYGSIGAFLRY